MNRPTRRSMCFGIWSRPERFRFKPLLRKFGQSPPSGGALGAHPGMSGITRESGRKIIPSKEKFRRAQDGLRGCFNSDGTKGRSPNGSVSRQAFQWISLPDLSTSQPQFEQVQPPENACAKERGGRTCGRSAAQRGQLLRASPAIKMAPIRPPVTPPMAPPDIGKPRRSMMAATKAMATATLKSDKGDLSQRPRLLRRS